MRYLRQLLIASTAILTATGAMAAPNSEVAQTEPAPSGGIETVVVTGARDRAEAVQDVPLAVTVLTGDAIQNLHASDISSLSAIAPNLIIEPVGPLAGAASISIRGFSSANNDPSIEPGVAVYVDGVYQVMNTNSMADINDIDHIEVLRGPQGSLIGKSAGAGAILLTRTKPTGEFGFDGQIEYGSYNMVETQGTLNFPIVDGVLAGKIFGSYRRMDDYVKNLTPGAANVGGIDRGSFRGALLFTPTDDFSLYLTGDYIGDQSAQAGLRAIYDPNAVICRVLNVCVPDVGGPHTTRSVYTDPNDINENNYTANATWNTGPVTLTSITGYRKYHSFLNVDLTGLSQPYLQVDQRFNLRQFSEEARISSKQGGGLDMDGKLDWVVGAYFGDSRVIELQHQLAFGPIVVQAQQEDRLGYAMFGHFDYKVLDDWTLTFGIRHSWDKAANYYMLPVSGTFTTFVQPNEYRQVSFENTSIEGGVQYRIDDTKNVFFRYAEGYRAGGFTGLPASEPAASPYDPETSKDFEIGAKTEWLDNRLLFNITLYNTHFDNLQKLISNLFPNGAGGVRTVQLVQNAATAVTRGVELETVFRATDALTLSGNFGYLDAHYLKFISFDSAGNPIDLSSQDITYAPKATATVSADYMLNLASTDFLGFQTADLRASWTWRDNYQTSNTLNPIGIVGAFGTVDLSATLSRPVSSADAELTFYVKNIGNHDYIVFGSNDGGANDFVIDDIGRTLGVQLSVKF